MKRLAILRWEDITEDEFDGGFWFERTKDGEWYRLTESEHQALLDGKEVMI